MYHASIRQHASACRCPYTRKCAHACNCGTRLLQLGKSVTAAEGCTCFPASSSLGPVCLDSRQWSTGQAWAHGLACEQFPACPGATPEAIAQPAGRGARPGGRGRFRVSGSMQGVRWVSGGLERSTDMPADCRTACGYRHNAQCRPPRGTRRGVKLLTAVVF